MGILSKSIHNQFNKVFINFNFFRMINQYETVFILTPVLSETQMKEAVDKFKGLLEQQKATFVNEEHWGLKKLAYPIQKKSTGFYHLFEYQVDGQAIQELEVEFKRDERVLRFLTTRLDKHAIAYSERRRNKRNNKEEKVVEEKKD